MSNGAASAEGLHIAASQRIVGRHKNQMRMGLTTVRFTIERLVGNLSKEDERLRDRLEHATGVSISELVELSKRWPT